MTDEERARLDNFIWSVGGLTDEAKIEKHARDFEASIRADERENCAQVAEAEASEEHPTEELDVGYDMACQHIAAAIRARGSE